MPKLDQLTGLRYFAAIAVFLSHLGISQTEILGRIFGEGYVGVSFFFVLSGFVLSYSYRSLILNKNVRFLYYFLLRIVRLTPLHYLTAIPYVIAKYPFEYKALALLAINALYLQSWFPTSGFYFSFNAPAWSLSNELFFYLCFFFLAPLTMRSLVMLLMGLLAVVIVSATALYSFAPDLQIAGTLPLKHWLFYIFPGFRMLEFVTGMLIFHLWLGGFKSKQSLFPLSILFTLLCIIIAPKISEEFRYSLLYLPGISLMVWSSLSIGGLTNRLLSSKILIVLGNSSFAFYLMHVQILGFLHREDVLGWLIERGGIYLFLYASFALALISVASVAVHFAFEEPVGKMLRSFIRQRVRRT